MRMKWVKLSIVAVIALAGAAAAAQGQADFKQAVESRQGNYREIGAAMKGIKDQLRSANPLVMMVQRYAEQLKTDGADQLRETWFPPGTALGQGLDTAAKPDIWLHPSEFNARRAAFAREAAALAQVAGSGNIDAIRAQQTKLGAVCQSCHDAFRAEEKS